MKTMLIVMVAAVLSVAAIKSDGGEHRDKYCAKMRDGKKVVMHQGSVITADVTLSNGTKIQPDGTIVRSNGTRVTLREGECMDKNGVVAEEEEKDKKMVPKK